MEEIKKHTGDQDNVVAAVTGDGGEALLPRHRRKRGPCWFFHHATCSKGKECTFSHTKRCKEEKDKLAKPEPRGRSESKGPKKEGKGAWH